MRIRIKKSNVILTMVLALQLISSAIFAQVPQKMSYQAVIRDASKALVTNKTIGMRVRIAQGTQSGTVVYTETFSPTTNVNGLVSLEIGGAAGFSTINWANGPYFILTDADLTGGSSYTISGYSQLVSVPYALHAKTAESLVGGTSIPSGVTLPTPVSPTGSFFFKTDENILYVSNGTAWLPLSTHGSTPSGTTFPTPTNPGDIFFNTANKNFYYWDGTTWKLVSNIPNGTTLPAASGSVAGDPFFKTDTNTLYVFNGTSWSLINGLSSTLADGSLFVGNASNVATPTPKANIPISGFGAAATDVSLGSKNITNLATPLIPTDAANKLYVDSKVSTNLSGPTLPAVVGPAGNTFFNTTDKVLYISDGTKWLPVATDGSTPSGPTFPPLPSPGDVFYNTATNSYYYYDGTTWKVASSIPTGTTLPLTGSSGDPFFKSDTNTLYIYSNGNWTVAGLSNILANGSFYVGNASNIATATTKTNIPLSGFGVPTTSVSMGTQKLTNVATPTADPDAANKGYVDTKYSTTPSGPTLPAVPGAAGNTFFNTTDNVFYISDGTTWLAVTTDGSTPSGPTFPPSPSAGDVFYNTANSNYYYYDGTSWKIASSIPTGTTLPLTGTSGDPFFKTDTNTLYIYNNGVWAAAGLSTTLANGSFFVGDASNIATATTKTSIPLSGFGVPTTDVSMGTKKLTNLLTPTTGADAANKAYVDAKTASTPTGPSNPPATGATVGDVFYNTSTKSFYYFDGADWKLISSIPSGPTLPPTGNPGDTFYNTTTNDLYVYNNGTWNSTKVQADWAQNTPTADDYIKNKPTTLAGYGITDAASLIHNHPLDGLSDVTIVGKLNNDILQWDNVLGKWVNKQANFGGVSSVSVTTANGISGTVATPTTTPAISLTLGSITPTSVAATGTVTGSNISGTNTGDQTADLVSVTPSGNISSTNVQNALVELQGDINGITSSSHAAVTIGTANGLSLTGQQLSLEASTAGSPGAMSAADKTKLDGIAAGAGVNVQADWAQATITADEYIKNKPTIVSAFTNDAGYLTAGTLSSAEQDPIWNAAKGNYYTSLQLSSNFAGSGSVHWLNITNKPTTLALYGITDGMSSAHPANGITATNITNWNAAFSWGNHNLAGYLTTETDPIVAGINGIVKSDGMTISSAVAGIDYMRPNPTIVGATKTKITYDIRGLVTAGADATTADIAVSTDKNYVTDIQLALIGNQVNITGNAATVTRNADLSGPITSNGNVTSIASQTGTGSKFVVDNSPTLITPVIGVATATSVNKLIITAPANSATITVADGKTLTVSNDATVSGLNTGDQTLSSLGGVPTTRIITINGDPHDLSVDQSYTITDIAGNAATVTKNANLTGPITSVGNTTSIASQTGTGSTFVVNNTPTLITPNIGVAKATSINKLTINAPTNSAELTIADGKALTVSGTTTLLGGTHSGVNRGDQDASMVGVAPSGNISSTTVQAALGELQGDIDILMPVSHVPATISASFGNGLSINVQEISLKTATPAFAGAMSALDKDKLDKIADNAEVNVQADWDQTDVNADDYINHKPIAVSAFGNDAGYLTAETDPVYLSKFDVTGSLSGDLLKFDGTKYVKFTPNYLTSVTGANLTSSDLIVGGGNGALLSAVTLAIANGAVTSAKIADGTIADADLNKANIPLSGFSAPTADVSLGSKKIINLAAPTAPTDAVNKKYVDDALENSVPGNLYQGTVDKATFNTLSWTNVIAGSTIPNKLLGKICSMDATKYTWVAFPKAWGAQNFFYSYADGVDYTGGIYAVYEGFEKLIIPKSTTGSVDYQVWIFKTTPSIPVDLIVNN